MTSEALAPTGVTRSGGFGVAVLLASLTGAGLLSIEAMNRIGSLSHGVAPGGDWGWALLPLVLAAISVVAGVYFQRNLDRNPVAVGWLVLGYCLAATVLGAVWLATGTT